METNTITMAAIGAAQLATLQQLQNEDTTIMYCDALSEVATYITLADDPDLPVEKQLHWLRTISMIKADINTLANNI